MNTSVKENSWESSYMRLLNDWYKSKCDYLIEKSDEDNLDKDLEELNRQRLKYIKSIEKTIKHEEHKALKKAVYYGLCGLLIGLGCMFFMLVLIVQHSALSP